MSNDWVDVFSALVPAQVSQKCEWIEADFSVPYTNTEMRHFAEVNALNSFFNEVDYRYEPQPDPVLLSWKHDKYFVSVLPNKVKFAVKYQDPYENPPSTGYPRVIYSIANSSATLPLRFEYSEEKVQLYGEGVKLSTGVYQYCYAARNDVFPKEYSLEVSSFVVTTRPTIPKNKSVADYSYVSTAKVILSWQATDPEGRQLYHKLYFGVDSSTLSLVYQGYNSSFQIENLVYSNQYFWRVESVNVYGVSSLSPLFTFSTIQEPSRVFNYPNPFNPHKENTTFVIHMNEQGSAELSVYSELGDLCYQKTFEGLLKGSNEVTWDGKDNEARVFFNGTYVAVINRKYSDGRKERTTCRILVLK